MVRYLGTSHISISAGCRVSYRNEFHGCIGDIPDPMKFPWWNFKPFVAMQNMGSAENVDAQFSIEDKKELSRLSMSMFFFESPGRHQLVKNDKFRTA